MKRLLFTLFGRCPKCGGKKPCPTCMPGAGAEVSIDAIRRVREAITALPPKRDDVIMAHPSEYALLCEWYGAARVRLIEPISLRKPQLRLVT